MRRSSAVLFGLGLFAANTPAFSFKFAPVVAAAVQSGINQRIRQFTSTAVMSTHNEMDAAHAATSTDPAVNPNAPTFFDKLVSKQIPANIIFEDELCMAFRDINPQAPVHFLVIPKNKDGMNRLSNAREDHKALLGHLMYTAQQVARQEGLVPGGFRLVINDGPDGCQSVYHLHTHVMGGRQMGWPPG